MKRRNQLAILGGSALLALAGVTTASALPDNRTDTVPVQNVADNDEATATTVATTSTTVATTAAPTTATTTAVVASDPGPVAPAAAGAELSEVVANHEVRISDLEDDPAPTAPPATAAPTTAPPAPPTTTPGTTEPPTSVPFPQDG